jgi:hypothetical protein
MAWNEDGERTWVNGGNACRVAQEGKCKKMSAMSGKQVDKGKEERGQRGIGEWSAVHAGKKLQYVRVQVQRDGRL